MSVVCVRERGETIICATLSLSPHSTATPISQMRYTQEDLACPPQDDKLGGEREVEGGTIGEGVVDDWTTRNKFFSFVINLVIGCINVHRFTKSLIDCECTNTTYDR